MSLKSWLSERLSGARRWLARMLAKLGLPNPLERLRERNLPGTRGHLREADVAPETPDEGGRATGAWQPQPRSRVLHGEFELPDTGSRRWRLFVPALGSTPGPLLHKLSGRSASHTHVPLLVMLHGCKQDAEDFALGTRMDARAGARGWYVLYPEQARTNNLQCCWNWFLRRDQSPDSGEAALLLAMIDSIVQAHPIDVDRVCVAGISAGGAMAALLASIAPRRFAAVGVHSGLPARSATNVAGAMLAMRVGAKGKRGATVEDPGIAANGIDANGIEARGTDVIRTEVMGTPTIVFQGAKDKVVNAINADYLFDEACESLGVEASDISSEERESGRIRIRRAVGRDGIERAERWLVEDAGHAWFGGDEQGSFTDARGPDASAEMLRFFTSQLAQRDGKAQR